MKQIFTLLLMALCSVVAFAEDVTYDFSSSVPTPWTCNVTPTGYETSGYLRGTQFNAALGGATLTLAGVQNATKVVVTCSSNIENENGLTVSLAGTEWGTQTFLKETNVEKTFTGAAASGNLKIDLILGSKSVWISKVVVTCDGAEGGNPEGGDPTPDDKELDPDYKYAEPTIVTPSGEVGSNAAYSFVSNNIKVSTTVGGQTADYFGCNAGNQMTFTATQPIKAIVINGYVKMGFEASCDHGDIMYVDASEDAVEANPVLAILDVDSKSVTISCVKQMRCYEAQIYFAENPEIEEGGGEEGDDEYTYDYEPLEKTNLDITFDEAEYVDYTDYVGFPYTDMYFIADEYEMELSAFCEAVPVTMLPVGTYEISDSYEEGTVEASPGGDDYYDYPSYIAADFEYDEEYEAWVYNAAYYLISGTLTIAEDPAGVKVTLDAKTYNGSTVKATFVGKPDGEEEQEGINTVIAAPASREGKNFSNGRVTIRHNGKTYTTSGIRLR